MEKKGRSCELCSSDARMFCESDQARLCWDCDEKVHAANFLVAKHTRTALCHVCHSPTPWKASGHMLGRTVSVCGVCVARSTRGGSGSAGCGGVVAVEEEAAPLNANVRIHACGGGREWTGVDDESEDDDDDDEYESGDEDISDSEGDDESDCCDDDDDENQVVPWTSTPPPQASATSTSSSEEEDSSSFGGGESASTSRFRDLPFTFRSASEIGARGPISSSTATRSRVTPEKVDGDIICGGFARPVKYRRLETEPNRRLDDLSR